MAKSTLRHPSKSAGILPTRTVKGGSTTPRKTGKGRLGMGLGYHGKPRGATKPATGRGYHGKPPHAGATTPKAPKMKRAIRRLKGR